MAATIDSESGFTPVVMTTLSLSDIIKLHSSAVSLSLRRMGVARDDVEDARQRVWLTAAQCIGRIRHGAERSFLMALARREAGHVRRSYRRRPPAGDTDVDTLAAGHVFGDEALERRRLVQEAEALLADLEQELRSVLWLGDVVEASAIEIAEQLEIPVGTAKSRLRRARAEALRRGAARTVERNRQGESPTSDTTTSGLDAARPRGEPRASMAAYRAHAAMKAG
jgi:RNA polymerase sigma-70 factor, ECF subfamily